MKPRPMTKITSADIVLWLHLPGRTEISERHLQAIKPYRQSISHNGDHATLHLALKLERNVFSKKRQMELRGLISELAPYKLVAEIAIYHSAGSQVSCSELPPRIFNCLSMLGAQLTFASYISS